MTHRNPPRINFMFSLVAITVLPFLCIEKAAARFDPYFSDPNTIFFGKLIMLNDELNTAGGEERGAQQTQFLEAALQPFDIRGSKPTPTNRVSLQPSNLPTASGSGTNLSRDGSCAVGYQDAGFSTPFHALRWTQATGPIDLGTLGGLQSFATDTNQDCSVVVGFSDLTAGGATQHAFRWTQSNGMQDLNILAGASGSSRALGVSGTGTVIVGDAEFPAGAFTRKGAFRWTDGSFTDLIPGLNPSLATAVSADGTVVVGQTGTTSASSAFRWTAPPPPAQPVMQPIGPLSGHTTATAIGVSDNGKIVVGISNPAFLQYQGPVLGWNQGTAFRWAETGPNAGTKDLKDLLVSSGINMSGISLVSVTGISPDGQWIQGRATTPQTGPNETVAFIAQFCDENIVGGVANCTTSTAAPFTLGASPNQLTVSAGNSGTTTITVTPDAGFTQPVNFSCGNLPVGTACSFSPPTVTPVGAPISTTLTIGTNGGAVAAVISPTASSMLFAFMLTPMVLLPVGLLIRRRGSDRSLMSLAAFCLVTATLIGLLSCSGDDSALAPAPNSGGGVPATGTPAGTSTVSVTATSGGNSRNVPVTLTVTRP
jgi:probable HAF family extracellular repeat protein